MNFFERLLSNQALVISILAWLIAQILKILIELLIKKETNYKRLFETGVMPSSHSAFITSLAVVIGLDKGWASTEFGIAFGIVCIVTYDAAGIRRAAGNQAKVINKLITYNHVKNQFDVKLKELLGHSPAEVFVGIVLGIIVAVVSKSLLY